MLIVPPPYKKRLIEFDVLKGIGIISVLIGHVSVGPELKNLIYSYHMPLFFLVSGFFYKEKPLWEYSKHKSFQLLIPWVFFLAVLCLYFEGLGILATHSLLLPLQGIIQNIGSGLMGDENSYCYYTIWFLIALFLVSIAYAVLVRLIRNKWVLTTLFIGLYIIGWGVQTAQIDFPYFLDTVCSILIYFHLGYLFKESGLYKKLISLKISLTALLLLFVGVAFLQPVVDLKYNVFPIYYVCLSSMLVFFLYQTIKSIAAKYTTEQNQAVYWLARLGNDSLIIFGLHRPIYECCYVLQSRLNMNMTLFNIVMVFAAILISELLSIYLYKYVPYLVGKK